MITTLMRVLLHLVTLLIQLHQATMRTHRHHKNHTILRPPAVHTHLTRAISLLHLFLSRVTCSFYVLLYHFFIVKCGSIFFITYYYHNCSKICHIVSYFFLKPHCVEISFSMFGVDTCLQHVVCVV